MHGIVRDKESTSFSYSSRCFYIEPVHFICTNALCCVSIENEFRFPLRNRFFNYLLKDVESFLFPDLSRKASSELVWHTSHTVWPQTSILFDEGNNRILFTVRLVEPGHLEEDYPFTTVFENKRFSSFLANGPLTFTNLRTVPREVR